MEYGSLWNRGSPTLRGQYMTAPGAEVLSADSVELVCWKTVLKLLWGKHCVHTAIQNTVFNTVNHPNKLPTNT